MAKSFWAEVFDGWKDFVANTTAILFIILCLGCPTFGLILGLTESPWYWLLWLWLPLARIIFVAVDRVMQ